MKAALRDRYGPPDVVELRDIDRPLPADDEVLVRVEAASVNRADLDGLTPHPKFARAFLGVRAPRIHRIGIDVAGVVEAVGPRVTRFTVGDDVFADLYPFGQGAFAAYVAASERAFQSMPAGMTFEDAATLPHSAILALQGLRRRDGRTPRQGDTVLIDGASGNVGPFAVQIAKSMGAEVTGCAAPPRSTSCDRSAPTTCSTTARSTTPDRRALRLDRGHRLAPLDPAIRRALKPDGVYVTLGGTARSLLGALVLGPLVSSPSQVDAA